MIESERKYKRIQNIISEIGGFYKFAQLFALYLNYFYNSYIVLSDTQILLNNLIQTEKDNIDARRNIFQKLNNFKDIEDKKEKPKEKDKNELSSTARINNSKANKSINNSRDENYSNIIGNNLKIKHQKYNIDRSKIKSLVINNKNLLKSYNSSFYKFLLYKLYCDKKNKYYNIYHNFRTKIISEEHFIRSHLNVYNLLRISEKKRNKIKKRFSYQINDLINLI